MHSDVPHGVLAPNYVPYKPFSEVHVQMDHRTNTSPVCSPPHRSLLIVKAIREIQMFSENADVFTSYINNVYLYPLRVKGVKQKHIQIFAKVKDMSTGDLSGPGTRDP